MKIEDVNRTLGYTPVGGMYIDNNGDYQTTGNFTTKLKDLSTWESIKSNGTATPDGANTEEALGEYMLDGYFYTIMDNGEPGVPYAPAETSNVVKNLVFGTMDNAYGYWLASRGVFALPDYAFFGPGAVGEGYALSYIDVFYSYGCEGSEVLPVRALVSLKSEIPAGGTVLVGSEAWE